MRGLLRDKPLLLTRTVRPVRHSVLTPPAIGELKEALVPAGGLSSTIVLCIFCNKRRPKAEEDVISQWLSDELHSTGQVTTEFITQMPGQPRMSRSQTFGNLATLKLHRVCHDCNNGWMSNLEKKTAPILIPMIRGETHELTIEDQRQIAAWSQMKCLTLDAFYPRTFDGTQHLPPRTAHSFCQNYQPLISSTVTLGRFIASAKNEKIRFGRHMSSVPSTSVYAELDVVVATFAFGQLLVQVSIGASGAVPPRQAAHSLVVAHSILNCWPSDRIEEWPPNGVVIGDQFDEVAQTTVFVAQIREFPGPPEP